MNDRWYVLHINPEPWAVGSAYRAGKGTRVSPNLNLQAYQEAVREEMSDVDPFPEGKYHLRFYFWRQTARYINPGDSVKTRNPADATNMQKALEDALQGVLFANDRDVSKVQSTIMAQGPSVDPCIVIQAGLLGTEVQLTWTKFPKAVFDAIHEGPVRKMSDNVWRGPGR